MHMYTRLLNWGGVTSLALGGLLALVGVFKGKEARQLEAAKEVQSLAALKALLNLVPLLVAVSGRVLSDKPYKTELPNEPKECAIVQVTEERLSERRTELMWVKESELVRSVVRETEWVLEDGSGVRVPVDSGQNAGGGFMEVADDQFYPAAGGISDRVLSELAGRRQLGTRKVERMLPLGTAVTVVGELASVPDYRGGYPGALRARGRMYVLREPKAGGPFVISRTPLPDLIASLKATSATCARLSTVFTVVGASMLLLSAAEQARRWWAVRKFRQRIERARREQGGAAAAGGGGAEAAGGEGEEGAGEPGGGAEARPLCPVCMSRQVEMVFPNCGHMCVCSACSTSLTQCPMCRTRGRPIRVYTP